MHSCLAWVSSLSIAWILVLVWHFSGNEPIVVANGLAYAGIGILAMALVSRCLSSWHPAFKRVSALLACAILAGVDIGLSGFRGEAGQKMFFAALLGIAIVVLAAKHAPAGLRRRWLGEDAAP